MHRRWRFALLLASSCATAPPPSAATGASVGVPEGTPDAVDIVKARARPAPTAAIAWSEYGPESFARAQKERRLLLVDGAAEWCHWCHVMDATTYRDPRVIALLAEHFVVVRVDVDARPDLQERWADYGWPATIVLSPDGTQVGALKGYIAADRFVELLSTMMATMTKGGDRGDASSIAPSPLSRFDVPASEAMFPWLTGKTVLEMDEAYDPAEGGWGRGQKAPIGSNLEVEIARARRGDDRAADRARFTLDQQRAIFDATWGGVYQYSAGSDWKQPHFEKLMQVQAAMIEAYARGAEVLAAPRYLDDARSIAAYLETHLRDGKGAFYVNQDADVGAHDATAPFVDGHIFYAKDDAGRRAIGEPWVDRHLYARDNGLAIAALSTLAEISKDARYVALARAAADAILASHVDGQGHVLHDATVPSRARYLADAATFGRALLRLHQATAIAAYRASAESIARRMLVDFGDPTSASLFDATVDSGASGAFSRRDKAFAANVVAARFLLLLAHVSGDPAMRAQGRALLAAIATPQGIDDQGRWLGDFILALDEASSGS